MGGIQTQNLFINKNTLATKSIGDRIQGKNQKNAPIIKIVKSASLAFKKSNGDPTMFFIPKMFLF